VLRNGAPVARQMVRLTPQQLERAQIVPHPNVNPSLRAALPGKPVSPPLVRPQASLAAAREAPRTVRTPPPVSRTAPISERVSPVAPVRTAPPRLITRVPPPPPHVPFTVQHQYMTQHPGRYLEPQQLENLRAGRRPGPMLDREFPPHVAPLPHVRVAPPAPPRKQ
jgi:hypothetical protein